MSQISSLLGKHDLHPEQIAAMSAAAPDSGGAAPISLLGLLYAASPLLAVFAIAGHLQLGLNRDLAIGIVRCVAQLSAVGYVLVPIFEGNNFLISIPYIFAMCTVAAFESYSRPKHAYSGMLYQVFIVLTVSSVALVTLGLGAVVGYGITESRYLIPLMGMLLGNSCSSVAIGLSAALEDLSTGRDKIEALLALGASRTEATRHVVRRAIRMALIGLVNTLNVTGLVTIPGMMTGQILGGSSPIVAARYQIMIFFLMAAATTLSATATIFSATFIVVGVHHNIEEGSIIEKTPSKDVLMAVIHSLIDAAKHLTSGKVSLRTRRQRLGGFSLVNGSHADDAEHSLGIEDDLPMLPKPDSFALSTDDQTTSQPTFDVKQLRRHVGDRLLYENINLSLRSGGILFVTGPSGCGKTKLLRSLAILDDIESGTLLLSGRPPKDLGWPQWRSGIVYVFQQRIAFNDIPGAETPSLLFAAAKRFSAQSGRDHDDVVKIGVSMGLDAALFGKSWKELSGGQAQRAQLAVAVALRPDVLLLDEPTSALDADSALRVEAALKECGAAIVWVSHDPMQPKRVGGRVLRLPEGSISEL